MRMPLTAPTPVPTMTAVGVASPRAHGQAMDSTVSAHRNANWNVNSTWNAVRRTKHSSSKTPKP